MKENFNIEELFREKLSGLEQDPPAEAWSAIQSGLSKGAAASGGVSGGSVLGWKGIAVLSVVTVSGGIFLGTLFSDKKGEITNANNSKEEVVTLPSQEDAVQKEPSENLSGNTAVVIKKNGDSGENKPASVTVVRIKDKKEPKGGASVANNWLTHPDRKDQLMGGKVSEKTTSEERRETAKQETTPSKVVTPSSKVELTSVEVGVEEPLALIQVSVSGGPAPLTVDFSNGGYGDVSEWNFGDGQSASGNKSQHIFTKPGIYTVTLLVSHKGKTSKDVISVEVIESSSVKWVNIFTPNGDGYNDRFELHSERIVQLSLQVYDRQGNILFSTDDVNFSWDGFLEDGTKVKPGVYFYRCFAKGEDGKTYKQTQTLTVN